ncbi:MAG: DUF2017 family protein [Acidimicrobiia bacterium]
MSHFSVAADGIRVSLSTEERAFLADVLPFLATVGMPDDDPAAARLQPPVYLDDEEANEEWWRFMESELAQSRREDRELFRRVVESEEGAVVDREAADAFLRVVNEARLALAARLGVEVEGDHDRLPPDSRQVLDYLGWVLEELTEVLSLTL